MKYKTNTICDLRHFTPKSYVLNNTIWKSNNNKQILAPNDYKKQHFLCSNLMSWPRLCESDNINQIITLTMASTVSCKKEKLSKKFFITINLSKFRKE